MMNADGDLQVANLFCHTIQSYAIGTTDVSLASNDVLNEVNVFPLPVVCQINPPASMLPNNLLLYATLMRFRIFSVAAI